MIVRVKDLTLDVDFKIDPKKNGWSIRFSKPNHVDFSSNRFYSEDEIIIELSKHYRFLKRRMTVIPQEYKSSIHLFGVEYELKTVESDLRALVLMGNTAYLYTNSMEYEVNKRIVNQFYEEQLKMIIDRHMDKAKRDLNITFPISVEYKEVKTYYGECIPKERRIIFQQSLAKYEEYYILSVLYHELTHFYYRGHQEGFYNKLESVFPGYRRVQAALRKTKYNDTY